VDVVAIGLILEEWEGILVSQLEEVVVATAVVMVVAVVAMAEGAVIKCSILRK
jgi:hypothetical protein